jgi:hypothetical protein
LKFLGRYCPPSGYSTLILQAIRNELAGFLPHTQGGALHAFGYILAGTIEIFPRDENLAKVEAVINDFIKAVETHVIDSLDMELADSLCETLKTIIEMLVIKKEKGLDVSLWTQHNKSVFYFLLRIQGVYSNFKLLGKGDPDHVIEQKKKVKHIFA